MRTWTTVALLVALLLAPAYGDDTKDKRVASLAKNAVKVRSIDPADEDFKDLEPLKKIIGDARIVQLGEQTHGDGACFLAKARLIKFLHQEMGFDVLAFESGLYDCAKGWQNLKQDPKGTDKFDLGIFGIWTQSHEVQPTLDYLRAAAKSKRPLELCGFDCQLTSRLARKELLDDLRRIGNEAAPDLVRNEASKPIARVIQVMLGDKPKLGAKEATAGQHWLAQLRAGLQTEAGKLEAGERAYWAQLTKSLDAQIENVRARSSKKKLAPEDNNRRDQQMGRNLIWLADHHYPKRKIIVWAATFHLMRNAPQLKPLQGSLNYKDTVPMGHVVAQHFGKACYTLGFSAYQGRAGRPWSKSYALPTAPAGSFDALCFEAGLENAIVDLRAPPSDAAWLHGDFVTRPLGNSPMRGPWHEVVDGLFFQRDMTPSTKSGYTPPEPSGTLLQEVETAWSNIQAGLRRRTMWANKWTFEPAFEKWRDAEQPDKAALKAQEKVVDSFLETHADEPEAVWRAHALLALLARAREDPKEARRALEAAMKAFPDKEIPQPAKTSQFQHLVNRYAFLLWEQKKKPPIKWAMDVVAKDKRLRFFYWEAWTARDSGVASQLRKALKKAYKARKKNFPDQAAEIDRALRGL